jgi:hypothetical protein
MLNAPESVNWSTSVWLVLARVSAPAGLATALAAGVMLTRLGAARN